MPKNTFFNLPEDKREKILDSAIDEFAKYSYHKASINRIVKKSGIAKGSFYQYFEDKKDLYKYIIDISTQKKLKYLTYVMNNLNRLNFFQIVRELYLAGIKFAKDNPKLSEIANNFVRDTDSNLKDEILESGIKKSNNLFKQLLTQGIDNGDIDPNIDIDLVAYVITSLSISISEYFIKEVKGEDEMEIMAFVDKMLYIIENGIKNKNKGN
ncbi:TetR/AcrR family transcriptional regulator [Thermohalobacter berrensis]|uniref:TetR family transcriptional regulator n=1 Tax=Thermohalobacter berrensis TaxID=99594 RepID=A0A419T6D6_9FIRM|nr:TetR/AcrR family transcriptional regulator [Thermohalobacter berrensis]RKD32973.1 TetR family transcriptional regulator [Thermohalobacter berrensis]